MTKPTSSGLHAFKPRPSSEHSKTMPASFPQGTGFQQLREAVSEANPRKRGFPYDSTPAQSSAKNESGVVEHDCEYGNERNFSSDSKRSRITDWPLKNTTGSGFGGRTSPSSPRANAKLSRGRGGRKKVHTRLSRFQEGSLNDKPSKIPPHTFLGAEDAMEQYHMDTGVDEGKDDVMFNAGIEEARPSSVTRFGRFGKAVASVFNGFWKDKETPVPTLKDASMEERKAKAEDAYALLKKNGFKGTRPLAHCHEEEPLIKGIGNPRRQEQSFCDSAIEIDDSQRISLQTVHPQYPSETLRPPSNTGTKRSVSPASDLRSGHRSSSLHFQTPAFQSLKKVKSQVHLPASMRQTGSALSLHTNPDQPESRSMPQHLRRQPSKKDFAKHQRLSKKVSDLESKLDIARRELEKSLQEAPPVPEVPIHVNHKPFVPGALASLPSERLLTPQATATACTHPSTRGDGSAMVSSTSTILSSPSRQLDHELTNSINSESACNDKRIEVLMSSDPIAGPDIKGVDNASRTTAQSAKNRRRVTRHSSAQKQPINGIVAAGVQKRHASVAVISKEPRTPPVDKEDVDPPVPTISITADDANKPRPASAYLSCPAAVSPVRTRSRTKKRGISPPPSSLSSDSKKKQCSTSLVDDQNDKALTPDSTAGNRQQKRSSIAKGSPAPKALQMKAARAKALKIERVTEKEASEKKKKPLPEIQTRDENFEWDEDVF